MQIDVINECVWVIDQKQPKIASSKLKWRKSTIKPEMYSNYYKLRHDESYFNRIRFAVYTLLVSNLLLLASYLFLH